MPGHVLERGEHVGRPDHRLAPLEATHRRHPHAGRQIGVLPVCLLDAPPPRIARYVDHGRQHLVHAARTGLGRRDGEHTFHQLRVPGAGERDGLREARGLPRLEAVERLLVKQDGNAEAGAVLHPALDGVRVLRLGPGPVAFARPLDASDADPKPFGCPRRIEPARAIGDGPLALPQAQHLADLLLERHAAEQVVDAAFDREARIQVLGAVLPGLGRRGTGEQRYRE